MLDETGFLKKGTKSVGVARQYSGTAGRIENCQVGVFLGYASRHGHVLVNRGLYLPDSWAHDAARRRGARVPERVAFRIKPRLGRLLAHALARGLPVGWVTGDEVYGNDPSLRAWLRRRRCRRHVACCCLCWLIPSEHRPSDGTGYNGEESTANGRAATGIATCVARYGHAAPRNAPPLSQVSL